MLWPACISRLVLPIGIVNLSLGLCPDFIHNFSVAFGHSFDDLHLILRYPQAGQRQEACTAECLGRLAFEFAAVAHGLAFGLSDDERTRVSRH